MKRKKLLQELMAIAKNKDVEMTLEEGGSHTIVRFDGRKVTIVGRQKGNPRIHRQGQR